MEVNGMFRIEVQDDNGNKTVIESKNAIVVYGDNGTNAISTFSADNNAENAEIIDLITDAKNVFVESVSGDERRKRLALVGLMEIMNGMKFSKKLSEEKAKMLNATSPFDFIGLGDFGTRRRF
jgi:hypothetical protein